MQPVSKIALSFKNAGMAYAISAFFFLSGARLEQSNPTCRGQVGGDGWTEPNIYLRLAQMQTSLATRTKKPGELLLSRLFVFTIRH
jgi:hypothetical protein